MKVKDASELRGIEVNRPAEPKKGPERASSAKSDKVSTGAKAQLEAAINASRQAAGSERTLKLESIEAAIRQGAFKPDPQRIAARILDDAELTAKLQALMKR
jgi:negative regulator of flagellin synthesis FlgM